MSKKTCLQCKKSFPETSQHFHKSKDGFHARCKSCRGKHERERKSQQRSKSLDEIEKGAVDLFVASARIGGANIPHSSELLEVLMEYFGGVRGFANAYMKQLYDAPAGGAFRTKMLDTVVRLVSANTAMGGAKKPLTLWTEDELEEELQERLLEAAVTINASHMPALPLVETSHQDPRRVPEVSADDPAGQGLPDDGADRPVRGVDSPDGSADQ